MAEKTPAEKMRLKEGMTAAFRHVPPEVAAALGVPGGVTSTEDLAGADFVVDFATTQQEAEEHLRAVQRHLGAETLAWLTYPKGSKAAGYDVNRDTIMPFARTIGLVVVANVAIDDRWSAVRLRPLMSEGS